MKENPKGRDKKQQFDNYVKFTNVAIQMLLIIGIGVFGGIKLDELLNTGPFLTIILSTLGVVVAIYIVIHTFLKS